ncbi:MAG: DUF1840 domain-containing protein [Caldimonas sp.]
MHYVFRSQADADLIMMAPAGDQILRIIGREPSARGIIETAALPAAIQAIEAAVAAERREHSRDDEGEEDLKGPRVGLRQRAWPMLEMMKRALAGKAEIVWGV